MYDIEKVIEPKNLDEALRYLSENENSIAICGGSDVLIKNREGKLLGLDYVCIRELDELLGISEDAEGNIHIGAATTFTNIENNDVIKRRCPYLSYAVGQVGGPQIRNIGTIGGNLCNGVPSADSATSVVILNADLVLKSVRGTRVIKANEFFVSAGKTVRERDELLVEIVIPKEELDGYVGKYTKYAMRKAMDIATLGVAMKIKVANDTIEDIKIAYGVCAPIPLRGVMLENEIRGKKITDDLISIIENNYKKDINPRDSWRASKEFREKVVSEILKRNISDLVVKVGGKDVYSY